MKKTKKKTLNKTVNFRDKELIEKIAVKYNVSKKHSELIFRSQFKFIKSIMEAGKLEDLDTFKTMPLLRIGKFIPRTKAIIHTNTYKNGNKNKK